MAKPTLALAMIVKNESKNIIKCVTSVKDYIDEFSIVDTGSTDDTVALLESIGIKPIVVTKETHPELFINTEGDIWDLNFSQARNLSFGNLKSDYVLWLDGDDTVVNAEQIPALLDLMQKESISVTGMTYLYEVRDGQVISSHPKERILKNGMYQWEYNKDWAVHENVYAKPEFKKDEKELFIDSVQILHHKKSKDMTKSGERNLRLLRWMVTQPSLKDDPRLHFLIGREAFGLEKMDIALEFLEIYLKMEYTPHDALISAFDLSIIYEGLGMYKDALSYAFEAIKVKPDHPLGYLMVAKYYTILGRSTEALKFIEDASRRKTSKLDPIVQLDYSMDRTATMLLAENYDRMGLYKQAVNVMQGFLPRALEEDKEQIQNDIKDLVKKENLRKVRESFVIQANLVIQRSGKLNKAEIKKFIKEFPINLENHKEAIDLKRAAGLYEKHENHIAIYCALNFEAWDPESIIKNGGGGSETAVIELASRFAKAGYKVTVFAAPKKNNTVYEGVLYKTFTDANFADDFDIFISWRNPWIFKDVNVRARKKYLWLQDIMLPHDYTEDLYSQLDKIIVLSTYHRETALHVPESKFYYTTNGINLDLIEEVEKEMKGAKREKGYCIYASSADRGLEGLVRMWPEVLKNVKKVRLTWFYGWNSWNKLQDNEHAKRWQEQMIKAMKRNAILEGGRVGKKELYKEYFKAQFLTYPLVGPAETSCITVMEAQACGAFPITTGITALEETQQFGIKVDIDEYKETLIKALNAKDNSEKYRKEMMKWARETFNWDRVADNWVKDLFDGYKK